MFILSNVVITVHSNAGLPGWQSMPYMTKYSFPFFMNKIPSIEEKFFAISGKFSPSSPSPHIRLHFNKFNTYNELIKIYVYWHARCYEIPSNTFVKKINTRGDHNIRWRLVEYNLYDEIVFRRIWSKCNFDLQTIGRLL